MAASQGSRSVVARLRSWVSGRPRREEPGGGAEAPRAEQGADAAVIDLGWTHLASAVATLRAASDAQDRPAMRAAVLDLGVLVEQIHLTVPPSSGRRARELNIAMSRIAALAAGVPRGSQRGRDRVLGEIEELVGRRGRAR